MAPIKKTKTSAPTPKLKTGSVVWKEFLGFCNDHARANYWFRGVSDKNHKLIPRIGRPHTDITWGWNKLHLEGKKNIHLRRREKRVFDAFRRRARLGLQIVPQSEFEWLAIAQHHGVPTRLLDWTANPLMAAWFAVNCNDPAEDQVARVYAVVVPAKQMAHEDEIKPFDDEITCPVFVTPPHWHPRIRAQRSCFSIHPEPHRPFSPSGMAHFDIEKAYWKEFRRRLYYFGIDASTVMADLSGLGEALAWQYENEIGIGQVGY